MNYYKRHIGDYAKKAGHLTPLEHGVYTLLLDAYYDREQAPTELDAMRVARARNPDETTAVTNVLREFFTLVNGRYIQQRVEDELHAAAAQSSANQKNGKLGGRPPRARKTSPVTNGLRNESENNPNPLIHKSITKDKNSDFFEGVSEQVIADFTALRRGKKAALTPTAVAGLKREADKAGLTLQAALAMCCERGWVGFKADWVTDGKPAAKTRQRL